MVRRGTAALLLVAASSAASPARADSATTRTRTVVQLADGVYELRHPDSPDGNLNGNTTVIIGEREVLVVDSCFLQSAAKEDIAQIRRWTNRPVRYLLNTHWHNDHNMGNGVYAKAYPGLAVIAHASTKHDMFRTATTPSRFVEQIAVRARRLENRKSADGTPLTDAQMASTKASLAGKKQVLEELKSFTYQAPTLTFEAGVTIDLGNREVEVRHPGRGATSGDAIVYLPKEKILIAGDLVTHPVLYTYDGYPADWVTTLDELGKLDADVIVPGHGDVLRGGGGKAFLSLCHDLLKSAVDQVDKELRRLSGTVEYPELDEVRKGVDLTAFRARFADGDEDSGQEFDAAAAALVRTVYNQAMHNR